jgi:hypothetical protein
MPPGIDQMWTTIAPNGAASGASRLHGLAADRSVFDSRFEFRGNQE